MTAQYQVRLQSSKIEKSFHRALDELTAKQQNDFENILKNTPKGTSSTHWTIKKVKKDVWQCDLPAGYRVAYTVIDKPRGIVLILFAGNHDDAATFLRKMR